jgi:Mn-dependent DtxR family transcriptional regulator
MEKLTAAMEDYLKTIYRMSHRSATIHVSAIAAEMGLSKASVCRATDFLSGKGLLSKSKYQGLSLTAEGCKQAAHLSQKNSIIQRFFCNILNVHPDIAEKDACSVEHCLSFESFQSICDYLENHEQESLKARENGI